MQRAHKEIELAVRTGRQPNALTHALAAVARAGVNVLAYCSYTDRSDAVLLLVTNDAAGAKAAIEAAGFACRANAVVMVGAKDQVGAVAQLGAQLGEAGIGILYSYASSASGQDDFCAVFKTMNDEAAIRILQGASRAAEAA